MILEGLSEIAAAPQTAGMTDGCHGNLFRDMIVYVDHHCFYLVVRFPVRSCSALQGGGGEIHEKNRRE